MRKKQRASPVRVHLHLTEATPDIFLCHSHADNRFVRRLANHLTTLSVSVWYDEWELTVGDSLHACIGKALERSAYVGVVVTPNSLASRWCRDELEQALTREKRTGKKHVLPLLRGCVRRPPFLENRLYLDFSRQYFLALARLAAFLHGVSRRQVEASMLEHRPRSPGEVKALISVLRAKSPAARVFSVQDYRGLRRTFGREGIQLDSRLFEIRPGSDVSVICVDEAWVVSKTRGDALRWPKQKELQRKRGHGTSESSRG